MALSQNRKLESRKLIFVIQLKQLKKIAKTWDIHRNLVFFPSGKYVWHFPPKIRISDEMAEALKREIINDVQKGDTRNRLSAP